VNELTLFVGRFHPLLVHFPIVLLILAGVFEFRTWWARSTSSPRAIADITGPTLALAALSALGAAGAGFLLGESGGYGGATLVWHERLGITVAIGASLTFAAWLAARRSRRHTLSIAIYRTLLATTVIVLIVAGHLGATLTHGEGYLTEHAPSPIRAWLARVAGDRDAAPRLARPNQAVAYSSLVQPILQTRCVRCHGPSKAEGKLRLDTPGAIRKGGGDGPVMVPGRAAESEIVRRIWLPPSHKDAMPPRGSQSLPASEAAVIRWWVDQGAPFDRKLSELEVTAEVEPAIEAAVGPLARGGPSLPEVNVVAPDRQAVAAASRLGVSVVPLASSNHFIEVHCTNAGPAFGDTELAALRPLAPQTVWLDLSGTRVTDAGLSTVAQFRNLTRLHLNRTRISDSGLNQLAGLAQLEYLNLYGTGVTDAGLQSLAALKRLRTLYVWQTAVTSSGLERLRSALPRLEIDAGLALSSARPTGH
jgi:uncharacterized membrane protein